MYLDSSQPLGAFLPQLKAIIEDSNMLILDRAGNPLPPCIVMEKGEALDLWAKSTGDGLDTITSMQVLPSAPVVLRSSQFWVPNRAKQ
jgi:hypothetical protein